VDFLRTALANGQTLFLPPLILFATINLMFGVDILEGSSEIKSWHWLHLAAAIISSSVDSAFPSPDIHFFQRMH